MWIVGAAESGLTWIKGTPSARLARRPGPGYASRREHRGSKLSGRDDRPLVARGHRGLAVAGRQLRSRPSGQQPYGRGGCRARLPRHRPAAGPRRNAPVPRHTNRTRPSSLRQVRRSPGRSQVPGRNAAHCPGWPLQRQGHPRSFLAAPQKRSWDPPLSTGDLCRPGGPDGEGQARGQARNARGEPGIQRAGRRAKQGTPAYCGAASEFTTLGAAT